MEETHRSTGGGAADTSEADGGDSSGGPFGRAKEFVGDKYAAASDAMRDKYAAASDAMRDKYNTVREKVDEVDFGAITDQVRSYVRSNPGKALLISVGAGFLMGLLLRRDEDED